MGQVTGNCGSGYCFVNKKVKCQVQCNTVKRWYVQKCYALLKHETIVSEGSKIIAMTQVGTHKIKITDMINTVRPRISDSGGI